jgi:hypothetical protein
MQGWTNTSEKQDIHVETLDNTRESHNMSVSVIDKYVVKFWTATQDRFKWYASANKEIIIPVPHNLLITRPDQQLSSPFKQ